MPVTININNLTLCHKGSNGISTATIPDVCKTPAPPAPPVPIPYPNIAMSMDLMKGTTTVKADGGMMCANYGSEFMKSTGDEPGVAGGVVSSVFIKEATWITFSFDVKLQGKAACRLTDKMFHNHQNTVNMGGIFQKFLTLAAGNIIEACAKLLEKIDDLVGEGKTGKKDGVRGLDERFQQQKTGDMGPNDAPDRGPNPQQKLYPNGSNGWQRHDEEIMRQQKNLEDHLDEFEQNCGGPTPQTQKQREWVSKKRPQPNERPTPPVATPSPIPDTSPSNTGVLVILGAGVLIGIGILATPVTGGGSLILAGAAAAVLLGVGLPGGTGGTDGGPPMA